MGRFARRWLRRRRQTRNAIPSARARKRRQPSIAIPAMKPGLWVMERDFCCGAEGGATAVLEVLETETGWPDVEAGVLVLVMVVEDLVSEEVDVV